MIRRPLVLRLVVKAYYVVAGYVRGGLVAERAALNGARQARAQRPGRCGVRLKCSGGGGRGMAKAKAAAAAAERRAQAGRGGRQQRIPRHRSAAAIATRPLR